MYNERYSNKIVSYIQVITKDNIQDLVLYIPLIDIPFVHKHRRFLDQLMTF